MSDERNEAEPIELGYIEDLGDMISVQEGSTVSRTVMQKAGGNVVLFSFDTGEELSEHTAAMPVFVQTLKGRLKVTGNGRTVELVPGGLAYFPTRIPHAIYAEEPSVMMLTMVTPARDNIGDRKKQDRRHRIPLDSPVPATAGNTRKAPSRELSFCGADNGTRTRGLNLGKVALYQLSYVRMFSTLVGNELKIYRSVRHRASPACRVFAAPDSRQLRTTVRHSRTACAF